MWLIACANLTSLLLARAALRRREFAVCTALGASRRRLLRQFMTEGAVLSMAGGALALWLARFGLQTVTQAYPTALPRSTGVGINLPVLPFTGGMARVTTLCFGLAQLRQIGAKGLALALTEAASKGAQEWDTPTPAAWPRGRGGRPCRHPRGRAGLLIRTVAEPVERQSRIQQVAPDDVLAHITGNDLSGNDAARAVVSAVSRHTAGSAWRGGRDGDVGGCRRIGRAKTPIRVSQTQRFRRRDRPASLITTSTRVMADYFETMGIHIVRGRSFQPTDTSSSGLVAIVNEKFAETFWKGRDPIGQRVRPCCNNQTPWFTVVGVAKDVKQGGMDVETGTELYQSVPQIARPGPGSGDCASQPVVLRSILAPASLLQTVERVLREMDPAIPVVRFRDMDAVFAECIQRPRFLAQLFRLYRQGLALLLAVVGTYGVVSSITAERRSEIAIRMALGANQITMLANVMREDRILAGIGGVVGIRGGFRSEPSDRGTAVRRATDRCAHAGRCGCDDDDRGSSGKHAAGLAGLATRSERGAQSIERHTT